MRYVKYKKYSGWRKAGTGKVAKPDRDEHGERVFWLTAMLEAPKWGSVQSYDGAGISAGPMHTIAVYPKYQRQGSLWGLMADMRSAVPSAFRDFDRFLMGEYRWQLTYDGHVIEFDTGEDVDGTALVAAITGPKGVVPAAGEQRRLSKEWITILHQIFSDRRTLSTQKYHAISKLAHGNAADEGEFYRSAGEVELKRYRIAFAMDAFRLPMHLLGPDLDLAMCVYHAYSVNAPGRARKVLKKVLYGKGPDEARPAQLIRALGTDSYGRWADTDDGRNRYDRTRWHVERSRLWPKGLVSEMMPENF